eukprot:Em0004g1019a
MLRALVLGLCSVLLIWQTLPAVESSLQMSTQEVNISTIYLISSCHLDVGFANTAVNILNEYFLLYFPEAISIANDLRAQGGEERLVFTTHPYLVYLYINCIPELGLACPNASQLDAFYKAVAIGDIVWHAFPFNSQIEYYDASMVDFGFQLTHLLDDHFNLTHKITMSQRDVPGTTRSLIPIMNSNGINALTVGVNSASMPPAVPSVFVWKDNDTNTDIIAMWHPHGYGGDPEPGPDSMVIVPGMQEALAFAIRGDNSGPPSADEVKRNYALLKGYFPSANIVAAGYDTFVTQLMSFKSQLPVFSGEIGDTWIHGTASDPWKTAQTREISRQRLQCMQKNQCSLDDPNFVTFSLLFLKNGEHTWGKDVKTFLHDTTNWSNAAFQSALSEPNFQDIIASWVEQRLLGINFPLKTIQNTVLGNSIQESLDNMKFNGSISLDGYSRVENVSTIFQCGKIDLQFSSIDGSINYLVDRRTQSQVQYASSTNPIGKVIYQAFTTNDYSVFLQEYLDDFSTGFAPLDFGKPGYNSSTEINTSPRLEALWYKYDVNGYNFFTELYFDSTLVLNYGAPKAAWVYVLLPDVESSAEQIPINITLYVVDKTATRTPESLAFYFNPVVTYPTTMQVSKLSRYINVLEVMKNGSKHLHASDNGIRYSDTSLAFNSLDTSLVCVGNPNAFPTPMQQPDVSSGFSFNIFNNIWGTNYIMWYPYLLEEANAKYRFFMTIPGLT